MKREKLENLKDLRLKCKLSHVVYKGEEMEEVGLHGDSKWLQCLSFLFLPILLLSFLIGGKKKSKCEWDTMGKSQGRFGSSELCCVHRLAVLSVQGRRHGFQVCP